MYIYIYVYLFIYLFVYLFIYIYDISFSVSISIVDIYIYSPKYTSTFIELLLIIYWIPSHVTFPHWNQIVSATTTGGP